MDDIFFFNAEITLDDVLYDPQSRNLWEFSFFLDEVEKISVFAVLRNDIDIVFGHQYVNGLEDVGMFEAFECINLIVEQVLFDFILYFRQFYHFDGDVFILWICL